MKNVIIKGKKYNIPNGWDDITLKQQIEVSNIASKEEKFKQIALLSAYCNIPIQELKTANINEVSKAFNSLTFLATEMPSDPIGDFTFKGNNYSVVESFIKREFQEWVSIETAFQNNNEQMWKALPYVIAVLAKKEGEKSIDDYDIEARAKEFNDLPISIANRLGVFFYLNVNVSNLSSQLYLNRLKILEEKHKEVESLIKSQDGGGLFTRLLRGILLLYLKFLKRVWMKSFTFSHSKNLKQKWKKILVKLGVKKLKEKVN